MKIISIVQTAVNFKLSTIEYVKRNIVPLYNLTRIINIFTGNNLIHCPNKLIELLRPVIIDRPYNNSLIEKCKCVMKAHKIKNKNVNIILCYNIVNKPILSITCEERMRILALFNRILSYWNTIKLKYNRKNLIIYSWILNKLLDIIGRKGFNCICQVKRRKKLYAKIWADVVQNVKLS